ncbi:MAG: RimK family alpha-L-glutamate ligase [Methylococcaceae bacterium]
MNNLVTVLSHCAMARKTITDIPQLVHDAAEDTNLGNMFMRMFYIASALDQNELALDMQAKALEHSCIYRVNSPENPKIRLLALMGAGNMTDNTPLDFLIEHSDIQLDLLYISPEKDLPNAIPNHDVAFVALGESDKNNPTLKKIADLLLLLPRPYINHPEDIMNCARHKIAPILQNVPGLLMPQTHCIRRNQLDEFTFPITVRPIDTHGGKGLEKINNADELSFYLENYAENDEFYVSEFVEYISHDKCYRKLRIALIDRKPFICHLAISENWMVHYNSSGMELNEHKRAEEQAVMENFDDDFAARHHEALFAIADKLNLNYVVIDCAETQDGELLLFEADPRCWIHATDSIEIFPYKPAVMQKAFDAFRFLLLKSMSRK